MKENFLIFDFLSASINKSVDSLISKLPLSDRQWEIIFQQAEQHRIGALVCSVIEKLPPDFSPPTETLLQFYGNKLQQFDEFERKLQTSRLFATALAERDVKMIILKGVAFGAYYEEPALRDFGDCDCYLGENQKIGDEVCVQLGGIVEHGTYKHSHLCLNNLLIENHRFFTDFNGTKRGRLIESILDNELNKDGNSFYGDTKMICPNPSFNALFLLKHHLTDFINDGLILRMIYDWAALLNREQNHIDWVTLYREMESCGLRNFADVLTSISVKYLGLKLNNSEITQTQDEALINDVVYDTLSDRIRMKPRETLLHKAKRILYRFERMWHYRKLSYESYPMMVINSFLFCYSIRTKIEMSR